MQEDKDSVGTEFGSPFGLGIEVVSLSELRRLKAQLYPMSALDLMNAIVGIQDGEPIPGGEWRRLATEGIEEITRILEFLDRGFKSGEEELTSRGKGGK